MGKEKEVEKVIVKFEKDYIAPRGQAISGQEGAEKQYPMTKQLKELIDDGTLKVVKKVPAATREKAAAD